jgi:hypothetical protein
MSSELTDPNDGKGKVLVPYVTNYTKDTPTLQGPFGLTAITAAVTLFIDHGVHRWMEHAPESIWIGSTVIAILVATVVINRKWLDFKDRRYFPFSLAALIVSWLLVVGVGYYLDSIAPREIDPAITNLQSQLATARRERDVAVIERDAARRESGNTTVPPPPPKPPLETLKADDIDARIDAWNSVRGLMDDFNRIVGKGDDIVKNWKDSRNSLSQSGASLRQDVQIARERLSALVGSNPDFSDLKIVYDDDVPRKLYQATENLLNAFAQMPTTSTLAEYESSIGSYIGPLRRQLASVKQWADNSKKLAESSVAELSAKQQQQQQTSK